MKSSTIILFGLLSEILLIFSCVLLNASKYYSEQELDREMVPAKPTVALRDRNLKKYLELSQKVSR